MNFIFRRKSQYNHNLLFFNRNTSPEIKTELKDGIVSTNSNGIYWKLLVPGTYLVKAVVFGMNGKQLARHEWYRALPIMESSLVKVEVNNKNQLTSSKEAHIVNLFVIPIN